jgi:hypothetical protein
MTLSTVAVLRPGDWVLYDGRASIRCSLAGTSVRLRTVDGADSAALACGVSFWGDYTRRPCQRASQRPLTSGVKEVADAVEVVREWVVACAHDAELAVEGADAGAELVLDLAEYRRSPDRHGSHRLWCADVKDTEVGRDLCRRILKQRPLRRIGRAARWLRAQWSSGGRHPEAEDRQIDGDGPLVSAGG